MDKNNQMNRNADDQDNQITDLDVTPAKKEKQKNAAISALQETNVAKGYMLGRFLALLVDVTIIVLLCWVVYLQFGTPDWPGYLLMLEKVKDLPASDPLVRECKALYNQCFIYTMIFGAVYEAVMLVFFRATIGKLIFRLRVVDNKEGKNVFLSKLMLVVRAAVKMISPYILWLVPVFMCLTAFGNVDRRSGFDMVSGTKVVDIRRKRKA